MQTISRIPANAPWSHHCAKRIADVLTERLLHNKGEAVADLCFYPLTINHIAQIIEDFKRASEDGRLAALLSGGGIAAAPISSAALDEGPSRIHAILETGNFRVKDLAKKLGTTEAECRQIVALEGSGLEINAQGWVKSMVTA